jgi:hypothetical protein
MDYLSRSPLVTRKKKKSGGKGKKSNVQTLKHIEVSLDSLEVELALRLSDGDLTLGIRRGPRPCEYASVTSISTLLLKLTRHPKLANGIPLYLSSVGSNQCKIARHCWC